jgi:hypothetical protein
MGVLGALPGFKAAVYEREGIEPMNIEYSGYNGQNGNLGDEYIRITGVTTTPLMMRAFAYASGEAKVTYSWGESEDDCCLGLGPCGGSFEQDVAKDAVLDVGDIPVGKLDVTINLKTPDNKDVDVQLYDLTETFPFREGAAIVAWCASPGTCNIGKLNGPNADSVFYPDADGLEYSYTGYNGQNGNLGDETISIAGETDRELRMKVFGYAEGKAQVTYSYWNPVKAASKTSRSNRSNRMGHEPKLSKEDCITAYVNQFDSFCANNAWDKHCESLAKDAAKLC